jgi:hypothetical protein
MVLVTAALWTAAGCCPFSVTAISDAELCRGKWCPEPEGIPFYLPKPLLIISKNFQYIEEPTIGLTQPVQIPNAFDNQANYASLSATASISTTSAGTPSSGGAGSGSIADTCCPAQVLHSGPGIPLAPCADAAVISSGKPFFTYRIIYVPDLTQKHYLRLKGGPGEVRATLNMVNGWMFTGLGPFYLKDSSTAQNILATGVLAKFGGSGAADVINSAANLSKTLGTGNGTAALLEQMNAHTRMMMDYLRAEVPVKEQIVQAEIHVYEPHVTPDGGTEWREITCPDKIFTAVLPGCTPAGTPMKAVSGFTPDERNSLFNNLKAHQDNVITLAGIAQQNDNTRMGTAVQGLLSPSAAAVEQSALQAITPPPPRKCWCDWFCCPPPKVSNTTVAAPTVAP